MPYTGREYPGVELPIHAELPAIEQAVGRGSLVLTAAPGAGKSSLVPLAVDIALRRVESVPGRVMLLQPRRLAAQATAARLADLLGEELGRSVGLTMRGEHRRGSRIEVVTEAILTRRLQESPDLDGVGAVIFDEFHERNLHSDLGLAMAIESRNTLRPDLRLVVMSATIDPEPIAALLGSDGHPVTIVDVPGRLFPITTEHRHRPTPDRWAAAVAAATDDAVGRVSGDVLVFAPGRAEIEDVISRLSAATDGAATVLGLHGSSPAAIHRAVLRPSTERRVIVATAVAETSVTIPGVEAVVDGGLSRRPRHDPGTATSHLVTEHVSRFSADQRRGRAGRTRAGICVRLWSAADHELLADQIAPEITEGDPLVVGAELLRWGDPDAEHLPLLDRPDPARLESARATMGWWGLTESAGEGREHGRLSDLGRAVVSLPVHPRVGALLATVARSLDPGDHLARLGLRAAAVLDSGAFPTTDDFEREIESAGRDREITRSVRRLRSALDSLELPPSDLPRPANLSELLALAWPDRIALPRADGGDRLLLASGREVRLDRSGSLGSHRSAGEHSSLGRAGAFVVVDSTVVEAGGRVRRAVPLDRQAITRLHEPSTRSVAKWDRRRGRIVASRQIRHGAIVLHRDPWNDPEPEAVQKAAIQGVRVEGLEIFRWSDRALTIRHRLQWLHDRDPAWPDVGDAALLARLDGWLDLSRIRSAGDLGRIDIGARLLDLLDWDQRRRFEQLAPLTLDTPSGRPRAIDWGGERPVWRVRVQELFGLDEHPLIGPGPEPLTIELLSPAGRVAQTTTDLPGFWRGSYAAVRADLRGRYPKHDWPEDPTA